MRGLRHFEAANRLSNTIALARDTAVERALSLEPAVVEVAPRDGWVSVRWRGATLWLRFVENLTDLAPGQVVLLLATASGPVVAFRLAPGTEEPPA